MNNDSVKIIPLGGVGVVTRNMYVYEYQDQMLLVDCGLGFADETMLGADLLLPDISYVLKSLQMGKRIIGMLITHGHEDHMGALPFLLPELPDFPIFATPLTAALATNKLKDFGLNRTVQPISFESNQEVHLGVFSASFIRVTHSVPDTSHIFIKTPIGNIYHGSDFKFDLTPFDKKKSDFAKIAKCGEMGVICLLSDCLGSERPGHTLSEDRLTDTIFREMEDAQGRFILTTYSSNINRLNQVLLAAEKLHKHVCFIGRSLIKTVEVAKTLKLIHMPKGMEIRLDQIKQYKDNQLVLLVAGSQGQENSALTRIATGEHKEVKMNQHDTVVFSSDPIPGNEVMVNSLVDTIAKLGARVMYSDISSDFHVSGHGSAEELMLLMELVRPKKLFPIGGTPKHMAAYKKLAQRVGYMSQDVMLPESGQEIVFTRQGVSYGQKHQMRNVYVDEISGEEIEGYVLRDRQKLSQEGVIAIMAEVDTATGALADKPDIIVRGFSERETEDMKRALFQELQRSLSGKQGHVTNWAILRKTITDIAEKRIFRDFRRRPLILPVVIEV